MSPQRMLLLVLAIVSLAACGGADQSAGAPIDDSDPPTTTDGGATSPPHDMDDMEGHEGTEDAHFTFGRPGNAADADRTVEISTGNELVFDPDEVTVARGDTVTFVVTNDGDLVHDVVVGDAAAQEEHAKAMAGTEDEMAMEGEEHGDPNAVSVPPGEAVELTWVFDGETDGLLYGCHEPGHYEAGMVGEIIVEG